MTTLSKAAPASAPSTTLDPFEPAVLVDPYLHHGVLRALGPVFRLERYGIWGMARHAEV
jgi:hypothetical protein